MAGLVEHFVATFFLQDGQAVQKVMVWASSLLRSARSTRSTMSHQDGPACRGRQHAAVVLQAKDFCHLHHGDACDGGGVGAGRDGADGEGVVR